MSDIFLFGLTLDEDIIQIGLKKVIEKIEPVIDLVLLVDRWPIDQPKWYGSLLVCPKRRNERGVVFAVGMHSDLIEAGNQPCRDDRKSKNE